MCVCFFFSKRQQQRERAAPVWRWHSCRRQSVGGPMCSIYRLDFIIIFSWTFLTIYFFGVCLRPTRFYVSRRLEICPFFFSSYAQLNMCIFRPASVAAKRVKYWASWDDLTVKVYYTIFISAWLQMIKTTGGNRPGSVIDTCWCYTHTSRA